MTNGKALSYMYIGLLIGLGSIIGFVPGWVSGYQAAKLEMTVVTTSNPSDYVSLDYDNYYAGGSYDVSYASPGVYTNPIVLPRMTRKTNDGQVVEYLASSVCPEEFPAMMPKRALDIAYDANNPSPPSILRVW